MTESIDELREEITKACEYVLQAGGRIVPGAYGTEDLRTTEVVPGHYYCPIGALEVYRKQHRGLFKFAYRVFAVGFDSNDHDSDVNDALVATSVDWLAEYYNLGKEFRKKFLKEAV